MKHKLLFIFLINCQLLYAKGSQPLTFFISPQGKDSNPGTSLLPFASLKGARDHIRLLRKNGSGKGSIKVIIKHGSYFLSKPLELRQEDSGAENELITYTSEKNAHPVFYGGLPIKGFKKVNDRLWRVFIPKSARLKWNFEQLYVNGQRAQRARSPNSGFYKLRSVTEKVLLKNNSIPTDSAIQKISLDPEQAGLLAKLNPKDQGRAVITFYHKWDNTIKRLMRYDVVENVIYTTGKRMVPFNKLDSETLFIIENIKSGLDAPGEWYLEKDGYLYYMPRPGENLLNVTCFAPLIDQFMIIKGSLENDVKHISFENLSFKVAGYELPVAGREPMQAAAITEAAIMLDYTRDIRFINCEFAHLGMNAIWYRKACFKGKVLHCYMHDLGAGAIKIGEVQWTGKESDVTNNITIDNNILRSGGHIFPCAVALIIFNARDNSITHNEIADFKYSGISVGWSWGYSKSVAVRNKIEFNHIHHLGWGVLSDMGGVYTLGKSEGTTVSNNVIHHVYSNSYGGWGLYTDEGSSGIRLENNLVYNCKSSAFHQHYGIDNIVKNNIFYNQMHAQLEASRVEPHIGFKFTNNIISYSRGNLSGIQWDHVNFSADSNIYWDTRTKNITVGRKSFKEWQHTGKDIHSLIADPGFVNPALLDFRATNKEALQMIGFRPFNYSKAGVYGMEKWKNLAAFDKRRVRDFDDIVRNAEKISTP